MALNVTVLVATLISPFTKFAYGGYLPILLLSMLFCLSVKDISLTKTARTLFNIANAINLVLSLLLLLRVSEATQFFLDHYAYGYDELLPFMFEEGKPVLTFGSHSLASFFFYLLFYLNLETFIRLRARLNLGFAFGYLALLTLMSSFTAIVFTGVAVVQLVLCFQWRKSAIAGLMTTVLLLAAAVAAPGVEAFSDFREDIIAVFHREDNGLLGRYGDSGGLSVNVRYILDHPFRPIGLGLSDELWYADSGPIEYLLKGSLPLMIAVYLGAFLFFWNNLRSPGRAIFVFLVFLGFEFGYSNLEYIRTQCFLPFLVVYLNWLDAPDTRPAFSPARGFSHA